MRSIRTKLIAFKAAILVTVMSLLFVPAAIFAAPEYADTPPPAGATSGTGPLWVSPDGRYVAFSGAYDYIGDGGGGGQFLRDRQTQSLIRLVGLDSNHATILQLTPDLRYAVLNTDLPLVAQDTNNAWDVYLLDRTTGNYELISQTASGGIGSGDSITTAFKHGMSADARYVSFYSWATNMGNIPAPADAINIYVRDRVTQTTTLISTDASGNPGTRQSSEPTISNDGHSLSFFTDDPNIDSAVSAYGPQIEVQDLTTGVRTRASAPHGTAAVAGWCSRNAISANGRYVAFACYQSLTSGGSSSGDVYRYDRQTDTLTALSQDAHTSISGSRLNSAAINGDGTRIIYTDVASNTYRWDLPSHTNTLIATNNQFPVMSENGLVMAAQELSAPSRSGVWTLPSVVLPDTTPPTIAAQATPVPNAAGWNNSNVTVTFTCTDNVAVANCPAAQTISTDGANQVINGTATDTAGNTASTSVTVNLDKTTPTVSNPTVTPGFVFFVGTLNVSANAADTLSGVTTGEFYIDTDPGQGNGTATAYNNANGTINGTKALTFGSLSVGPHTVYIRAKDTAGNWSTVSSRIFFYL